MKFTIALLAVALSLPSHATEPVRAVEEGGKREETQRKMKEQLLRHIEARIRILQDSHACIKAATDIRAIGECHEEERKRTRELREQANTDIRGPR